MNKIANYQTEKKKQNIFASVIFACKTAQ